MAKITDRRGQSRHFVGVGPRSSGSRGEPEPGKWLQAIDKVGAKIEPHPSGCWLWTGRTDEGGYGHAATVGIVHRFVYKMLVGPIPRGHVVHHECGIRTCCNPAHLVAMSNGDHVALHHEIRRLGRTLPLSRSQGFDHSGSSLRALPRPESTARTCRAHLGTGALR